MTTASVYADSGDGLVNAYDYDTYANLHATANGYEDAVSPMPIGQADYGDGSIEIDRLIFPFTLALGAGATISAAELRFTRASGNILGGSTFNFTAKILRCTGVSIPISGAPDTDYDAAIGGTNEGDLIAVSSWSVNANATMSVDPASVNANGTTYYSMVCGDDLAVTAPAVGKDTSIKVYMSEEATAGYRPQLTVTYTLPSYSPTWALTLLGVGG